MNEKIPTNEEIAELISEKTGLPAELSIDAIPFLLDYVKCVDHAFSQAKLSAEKRAYLAFIAGFIKGRNKAMSAVLRNN